MHDIFCPITGEAISPFFVTERQPIFMGTTSESSDKDVFNDMVWGATKSGVVQLVTRIPLDVLYSESHNSGFIGKTWLEHHREFANFIANYGCRDICEIGGGHGILSREYRQLAEFSSWEVFEPNARDEQIDNIKIRHELFTPNSSVGHKDCFVHSHLFEHLYDHRSILKLIHSRLDAEGYMIFSMPNMVEMVKNGYVNALNFEHVTYLPEDLVEFILMTEGFQIADKQYFKKDHSIFYCCQKCEIPKTNLKYSNTNNTEVVRTFFEKIQKQIHGINKQLNEHKNGEVFLFGAHIFSQYYASNGLDCSSIINIIDNDPSKVGERLYGTSMWVENPSIIKGYEKPSVVLKVGAYREEILQQLYTLNPDVNIIE